MRLENTYKLLEICCVCITFVFSACFLLLKIPQKESLKDYRISRKIMSVAYFSVGTISLFELYHTAYKHADARLSSLLTLILGSFLALLFSFTLQTLINMAFVSRKKLLWELILVSLLATFALIAYLIPFEKLYLPAFSLLVAYYISLLIRHSYQVINTYRLYAKKMDNYYSVQEANKLKWVKTAYFAAISIGSMVLFSLYLNEVFAVFFIFYYISFFVYFGIRFLNYVSIFEEIETVMVPPDPKKLKEERESYFSFDQLEQAVNEWEKKKLYKEPGLTIEQVAGEIMTNRTYLSNYINTYKKMTFNEWISHLRMEEAKKLLIDNPQIPVGQIGVMIGVPDKSNFGRQFAKRTGNSPMAWRTKQHI